MDVYERSLELHRKAHGKLRVECKVPLEGADDLSLAYSPGVAQPCLEIQKNYENIYEYTAKGNMVAVVTNGTAVLGLGDIGAGAGLPVMEGKSVLFKSFAGVDAFPICLDTKDPDKIVEAVKLMEPTFGGVNLEDIKAPECFYIEQKLKEICNIPIFHDDQHGTAIVTLAGLINALKVIGKDIKDVHVVVSGAGAAAIAITKLLLSAGIADAILCDSKGAIYEGRDGLNPVKAEMAKITNPKKIAGSLADVIKGADVFVGVSAPGVLTQDMIKTMAKDPIIFACANPTPEIDPALAKEAGAAVVGTGRSDYPNQVNNVLAFPGLFRGALDVRSTKINEEMKIAAAHAIASLVSDDERNADYVIPSPFDPRVAPAVAQYVAKAAIDTGVAQKTDITPEQVAEHTRQLVAKK